MSHTWTPSTRDLAGGDVQACRTCGTRRRREVIRRPRSVQVTRWAYEHAGRWHVLDRVPPCKPPRRHLHLCPTPTTTEKPPCDRS